MAIPLIPRSELQVVDPARTIVRGYAAVFGNEFKHYDFWEGRERTFVIGPGAFKSALERLSGPLPIYWHHETSDLQIGETSRVVEDDFGLYYEGRLFATTPALDVLAVISGRSRTGASIGFEFGEIAEDDDGVEHMLSFSQLFELGPCPIGANPLAYSELVEADAAGDDSEAAPVSAVTDAADAALALSIYRAAARMRRF
jgi:HK97 family phage prohead protease